MLIEQAKSLYLNENDLEVDLRNNVFAIDTTVIDVAYPPSAGAKFRSTKRGVKVHVQLDLQTSIPEFVKITPPLFGLDRYAFTIETIPERIEKKGDLFLKVFNQDI